MKRSLRLVGFEPIRGYEADSCFGAGQIRPGVDAPPSPGRGLVRLRYENASGGGTVTECKCVRSH